MQSEVEVIAEAGTSLGDIKVEEITVYTSDGDAFNNFFNVLVDNEVKHPKLDARGVIRALATYMNITCKEL